MPEHLWTERTVALSGAGFGGKPKSAQRTKRGPRHLTTPTGENAREADEASQADCRAESGGLPADAESGGLPADAESYGPRAASEALRADSAAGAIPPKVGLSPAEAPFIEGKPRRADRLGEVEPECGPLKSRLRGRPALRNSLRPHVSGRRRRKYFRHAGESPCLHGPSRNGPPPNPLLSASSSSVGDAFQFARRG